VATASGNLCKGYVVRPCLFTLVVFKGAFGCNDRTGWDGTIPQIMLFGSGSRVGTGLSQCCPLLSLKIGGMREDA
jgi:hypothetical protein